MKSTEFDEQNIVFAEHQDEYISLPAHKFDSPNGEVVTCWKMSWKERFLALFTGRVYLCQLTFNQPLQPLNMEVDKWKMLNKEYFQDD